MRILVFGIHYSPDLTGIGKYTGEMNPFLVKEGHEVTMVTANPFYPEWKPNPSYSRFFWTKEEIEGVTVYRCPLYIPKNPTASKKILHEFTFLLSVFPIWLILLFKKKFDVVFGINPPFHLSIYPLLYKWIRGAKMVSHIQDLQIDVVKDMEMIRNKTILDLMFSTEKYFFDQSDKVTTISDGMEKKIRSKGINKNKQLIFPNWVDCQFIKPLASSESLREPFGIPIGTKVIMYSGNLGEKQGLELILEAAEYFKGNKEILFIIVGTGGAKERLKKMSIEKELTNVKFFPLQPYKDLPKLLAVPDIHLVLQKKEAADLVMPSKLTGILASGGLSIVSALPETTLFEIIKTNQMGILIDPGSVSTLIEGIKVGLNLANHKSISENARNYALSNLGKEAVLKNLSYSLEELNN